MTIIIVVQSVILISYEAAQVSKDTLNQVGPLMIFSRIFYVITLLLQPGIVLCTMKPLDLTFLFYNWCMVAVYLWPNTSRLTFFLLIFPIFEGLRRRYVNPEAATFKPHEKIYFQLLISL